jgi:hypothetical protein
MNIEDLIREANPVPASDLAVADSPHAQHMLAQILQETAASSAARRGQPSRRRRKRTLMTVVLAATAAGATVAALTLAVPGAAERPSHGRPGTPGAHPGTAHAATARQILLTAAANVTSGPATGRYWRVREIAGLAFPGGTKAHPYDILLSSSFDQWNPRSAGEKYWLISQDLGTVPATPADASAWRAAGSPTTWHGGRPPQFTFGFTPWTRPLYATTAASAPSATWTVSDGRVGYVEGDEPGLKAAQFREMPTSPRGVAAVLRHYYDVPCATHPGCSPENQFIWSEALMLLQDPVSAKVRSATLKVMASLPGVRLLGPMTDPLGRHGYGFSVPGSLYGVGDNPKYHPVHAVVIDPRSGSLLATEDIAPMPRNVQCDTVANSGSGPQILEPFRQGKKILKIPFTCVGPSYEGRSYGGQVDEFTALVGAGWTNASPVPPASAQRGLGLTPGLPPGEGVRPPGPSSQLAGHRDVIRARHELRKAIAGS